jgi:hypothetical protein
MQALIERPCVERLVEDKKGVTDCEVAHMIVSRAPTKRIGRSRLHIRNSVIEFTESRQSRLKRRAEDYFDWNT